MCFSDIAITGLIVADVATGILSSDVCHDYGVGCIAGSEKVTKTRIEDTAKVNEIFGHVAENLLVRKFPCNRWPSSQVKRYLKSRWRIYGKDVKSTPVHLQMDLKDRSGREEKQKGIDDVFKKPYASYPSGSAPYKKKDRVKHLHALKPTELGTVKPTVKSQLHAISDSDRRALKFNASRLDVRKNELVYSQMSAQR